MISIARHMDEFDIAREVRLERQVHKGAFLILEGDTDIKRFGPFVDEVACSVVNCYGRDKGVEATKMLYEDGFEGCLAIVDADFDRLTRKLQVHEGIIYSERHDLDLDWAQPNVVKRYLAEAGDKTKCAVHGPTDKIIMKVMEGLRPVSVARLLNHLKQISQKLSEINVVDCFRSFSVDLDDYLALIFQGYSPTAGVRDAVKQKISQAMRARNYDLYQLTNGHDFHCALGACLMNELGSRKSPQAWGKEVEMHLRLAFDTEDFKASFVFNAICQWVSENPPFRILRPSLA